MTEVDPWLGKEIGSYRLIKKLGQGGIGAVYLGKHPAIGKQVAIKRLTSQYSDNSEMLLRLFREARASNDISHPNIVDVLDFGQTPEGDCYLIMEYLEGVSLADALDAEAPFSEARAAHIGRQICAALSAAHQRGVIHRDLKPENVFLCRRGEETDFVKVLDFGIAKLLYDDAVPVKTAPGIVLGTPLYMAPEQALQKEIDAAIDIYALGLILYQMATGHFPFHSTNRIEVVTKHITTPVEPPRAKNPRLSLALERVILRCLEKDKARRYPSMLALSEALTPFASAVSEKSTLQPTPMAAEATQIGISVKPKPSRARGLLGLVVGALLVGGAWAASLSTTETPRQTPAPTGNVTAVSSPASSPASTPETPKEAPASLQTESQSAPTSQPTQEPKPLSKKNNSEKRPAEPKTPKPPKSKRPVGEMTIKVF